MFKVLISLIRFGLENESRLNSGCNFQSFRAEIWSFTAGTSQPEAQRQASETGNPQGCEAGSGHLATQTHKLMGCKRLQSYFLPLSP